MTAAWVLQLAQGHEHDQEGFARLTTIDAMSTGCRIDDL